jgi:(1->4)-alpha-D-glucan 1-alpha-D-glucosylmutase
VDPDNRRPVDWGERERLLDEVLTALAAGLDRAVLADELVKTKADGRIKLFVVHQGLAFRRARRALFEIGAYRPLEIRGPYAEHVCAFARVADGTAAVTVIPRLLARRGLDAVPLGGEYWADTRVELPRELGGRFTNVLTGERLATAPADEAPGLPLADILAAFPVALLEREGDA